MKTFRLGKIVRFRPGLTSRLYAGFGVLVVLGLGLATFAVWQFGAINTGVNGLSTIAANASRLMEAGHQIETMRRASLLYQLDGNAAALKEANDAGAKALDLIRAGGKAMAAEDDAKAYARMEKALGLYQGRFEGLVEVVARLGPEHAGLMRATDELTAATDNLIKSARASDQNVAGLAQDIGAAVAAMRVTAWRFQATRASDAPPTFNADADRAAAAAAALEAAQSPQAVRSLIDPVKAALAADRSAFASYAADNLKCNFIFNNEMAPMISALQRGIDLTGDTLSQTFGQTKADVAQTIDSTVGMQEIVAGMVLLVGVLIASFVGRSIVRPVSGMTRAMERLAAGDTSVEIPSRTSTDEIGAMAKAVEVFKDNAVERRRLEAEQREIEARAAAARKADMQALADRFKAGVGDIIATLSSASTQLESAATTLTQTAETTEGLSNSVASASEQASSSVGSVARASEELAQSVQEIAGQINQSTRIATEAVRQAERTDARIHDMSQAAGRIGDVVKLITAIAEQTNLLALNATIEAARAGEAGRGFAVVASEVKQLATQTASATEDIGVQIAGMQAATRESVAAIKEIGATIGRISDISGAIAAAMEQQGAATREIASSIAQAAQGTSQVAANIVEVSRGARETGVASSQVLTSAQTLSSQSNHLKLDVDKFLDTVRAA